MIIICLHGSALANDKKMQTFLVPPKRGLVWIRENVSMIWRACNQELCVCVRACAPAHTYVCIQLLYSICVALLDLGCLFFSNFFKVGEIWFQRNILLTRPLQSVQVLSQIKICLLAQAARRTRLIGSAVAEKQLPGES